MKRHQLYSTFIAINTLQPEEQALHQADLAEWMTNGMNWSQVHALFGYRCFGCEYQFIPSTLNGYAPDRQHHQHQEAA